MLSSGSSQAVMMAPRSASVSKNVSKDESEGAKLDTKKTDLAGDASNGASAREMPTPSKSTHVANWIDQQPEAPAGPSVHPFDEDFRQPPKKRPDVRIAPFNDESQQLPNHPGAQPLPDPSGSLPRPSPQQPTQAEQPRERGEELTPQERDLLNIYFQVAFRGGNGHLSVAGVLRGGGNCFSVESPRRRRRHRRSSETTGPRWGRGRATEEADRQELRNQDEDDGDEGDSVSSASSAHQAIRVDNETDRSDSHSTFRTADGDTRPPPLVITVTIDISVISLPNPSLSSRGGVWTDIWAGDRGPVSHEQRSSL